MMFAREASAVRHAPGATEECVPPGPGSKWFLGFLGSLGPLRFPASMLIFSVILTGLRALGPLLLKAGNEVPKRRGLVHVCD